MVVAGRRHMWVTIGWVGAVTATLVNGVVVGYGAIWLQFFGDAADGEDYAVSAGGYAAAAVVLLAAVPAILAQEGPRWLVWPSGAAAVVLGFLAARSAETAGQARRSASPMNTAWDGVGGVVWAPWTWGLVALGIHGLVKIFVRLGRRGTEETRPDTPARTRPDRSGEP